MPKVLVTGGTGYIGSHTAIDLLDSGFDVISIDNYSRSEEDSLNRIEAISGVRIKNYEVDLCDLEATKEVFRENPDIEGIIHFAAFKSVPESVDEPMLYYKNNLVSLVNILECVEEFKVKDFVFSSSCSVYGNIEKMPVTEDTPFPEAESPYAYTKQIGEKTIKDLAKVSSSRFILLRYFNPVGAHESGLNGEVVKGKPQNLVPSITQFAAGKQERFVVSGSDYETRDGTCVRDYIHVMDIAHGHVLALQYLGEGRNKSNCEVFNLGSGNGVSVLEALQSFERVSGMKLNYELGPRRPGDVISIYADNSKAKNILGWTATRDIDTMMNSAWIWEQKMNVSV
ncbi:MAG: UDP-glucose 4-epimerase [Limisphaerales bacterium]|jgi:UDP-glucose 4-epimerase